MSKPNNLPPEVEITKPDHPGKVQTFDSPPQGPPPPPPPPPSDPEPIGP